MNISQLYIKGITYDLKDSTARYGFATASVNNELSQDGELDTSVLTFYADQAKQSVLGKIKLTKIAIPNLKSQKLIAKDFSISNEGVVSVTSKLLDSKQNLVFQGSRDKKQIYLPLQKNGVIAFISDIENVVTEELEKKFQQLDFSPYFSQFTKKDEMSRVAFTGDYNDLKNKPQIPSGSGGSATDSISLNDDSAVSSNAVFKETHVPIQVEWEDGKVFAELYSANLAIGNTFNESSGSGTLYSRAMTRVKAGDVVELNASYVNITNFRVFALCDSNKVIVELAKVKTNYNSYILNIEQDGYLYTTAAANKLHTLTIWRSKFNTSNNPVIPVDSYSEKNTIIVDKEYWDAHVGDKSVFITPNTKYIIAGTAEELSSPLSKKEVLYLEVGSNCIISANTGCMLGTRVSLYLNRTYIDVGPHQIFSTPRWTLGRALSLPASPDYGGTTLQSGSTFANGQIFPEWWGCKSGEGVILPNVRTHHNHKTVEQAYTNSFAINYAIYVATDAEVYLQGNKYVVGSTIIIGPNRTWGQLWPRDENPGGLMISFTDCDHHGNRNPKFRVKGNLIASDEFIGFKKSGNCEIPTIIYVSASAAKINIEGAVVVPYSARDKKIVTVTEKNWGTTTPQLGKLYFVGTSGNYKIYDVYEHYTSEINDYLPVKEITTRLIGTSTITSDIITKLNEATMNTAGGCNGVITGMYGIHLDYFFGGTLNVERIIKGEDRGGLFNVDYLNRLTSFRYRTEVWHMGECSALNIGTVQSSDINISQIVGFNDGITNQTLWEASEDFAQHIRFNIGNIQCNNAIHITTGNKCRVTMLGATKSGGAYFNACNWRIGGAIALCAGSNVYRSTFTPTTTNSTFLLAEHNSSEGNKNDKGFGQHMIILEPCPDSCYYHFINFNNANGNYIKGNGGIGGDTGRLVLWTNGTVTKDQLRISDLDLVLMDDETAETAWFPVNSCLVSSLYNSLPAHYNHIAAQNKIASGSSTLGKIVWDTHTVSGSGNATLKPNSTHSAYNKVKAFPFSNTTSFITFRASNDNTIESNQHDLLCYESVYSDSASWNNTLIGAQSMYALYEQTGDGRDNGSNAHGFWGVHNYKQPYFKQVKFNNDVMPSFPKVNTGKTYRVMYVDDFALGSLHFIENMQELPLAPGTYNTDTGLGENRENEGLYVVTSGEGVVTTTTYYGYTLYPMYSIYKYNPNKKVLTGYRSNVVAICEQIGYYCDELGILKERAAIRAQLNKTSGTVNLYPYWEVINYVKQNGPIALTGDYLDQWNALTQLYNSGANFRFNNLPVVSYKGYPNIAEGTMVFVIQDPFGNDLGLSLQENNNEQEVNIVDTNYARAISAIEQELSTIQNDINNRGINNVDYSNGIITINLVNGETFSIDLNS